jgi:hypothetical protein
MSNDYNILIIGDSFAADWSIKYNDYPGWPNLLDSKYNVINLAQAGVGEYKIYKQLLSIKNLEKIDIVIVSHTSPYRIYTQQHPVHKNDVLHKNADLMINDLSYHASKLKNMFNSALKCGLNFFKYHADEQYLDTVYQLFREKINSMLKNKKVIVISNLKHLESFTTENIVLNYSDLCVTMPGIINHISAEANQVVYNDLIDQIQKFQT